MYACTVIWFSVDPTPCSSNKPGFLKILFDIATLSYESVTLSKFWTSESRHYINFSFWAVPGNIVEA